MDHKYMEGTLITWTKKNQMKFFIPQEKKMFIKIVLY